MDNITASGRYDGRAQTSPAEKNIFPGIMGEVESLERRVGDVQELVAAIHNVLGIPDGPTSVARPVSDSAGSAVADRLVTLRERLGAATYTLQRIREAIGS